MFYYFLQFRFSICQYFAIVLSDIIFDSYFFKILIHNLKLDEMCFVKILVTMFYEINALKNFIIY